MAENKTAVADNTTKKRTVYKPGSLTDFPKDLDWSKYGYKWRSAEQLSALSDGYDPKQWELHTDANGKHIKRGDLILARMPIDLYRAMKDAKEEARKNQTKLLIENETAQMERDAHEFRKKGGKIKFEFKQE